MEGLVCWPRGTLNTPDSVDEVGFQGNQLRLFYSQRLGKSP